MQVYPCYIWRVECQLVHPLELYSALDLLSVGRVDILPCTHFNILLSLKYIDSRNYRVRVHE